MDEQVSTLLGGQFEALTKYLEKALPESEKNQNDEGPYCDSQLGI